ncbi:flagellar hook assembly protein FlgD [[Clostridium] fimetarium]|uniref:Flagellar basal-body rod modification protein FlgD n=1 Tax=[Clostridium] fimetarium TaxID=99656 RepID=A0A1I0N1Y8_9FIRM|nr:flagellar hook capping FlgD N-terminal domain-containing protein [[Clostridium] fimetarium]SEV94757.1 flagellar basal-body rod modification protein FlgD [[Clostridium] fimetarium]
MATTAGINKDGSVQNSSNNTTLNSTTAKASNSALDKDAFLQLLVAQMKYQDPLEPASNTEYIAQLATFSQVEELQNVSESMTSAKANALIGSTVVIKTKSESGEENYIGGVVERIVNKDGKTYLGVNGNLYDIDDMDSLVNDDFYKKYYLNDGKLKTPIGGVYVDTTAKTNTTGTTGTTTK